MYPSVKAPLPHRSPKPMTRNIVVPIFPNSHRRGLPFPLGLSHRHKNLVFRVPNQTPLIHAGPSTGRRRHQHKRQSIPDRCPRLAVVAFPHDQAARAPQEMFAPAAAQKCIGHRSTQQEWLLTVLCSKAYGGLGNRPILYPGSSVSGR